MAYRKRRKLRFINCYLAKTQLSKSIIEMWQRYNRALAHFKELGSLSRAQGLKAVT